MSARIYQFSKWFAVSVAHTLVKSRANIFSPSSKLYRAFQSKPKFVRSFVHSFHFIDLYVIASFFLLTESVFSYILMKRPIQGKHELIKLQPLIYYSDEMCLIHEKSHHHRLRQFHSWKKQASKQKTTPYIHRVCDQQHWH